MKLLIASDLHGSRVACERVLQRFAAEGAKRLILLGDLLYHGPRNDLPEGYEPKAVCALLNALAPAPLCVRGYCDAEIDQMVLSFPILADYMLLPLENGACAFVNHGHLYGADNPPPLAPGDLLIQGHTHLHGVTEQGGFPCVNPGSAALPKGGQPASYMIYEDGLFTIKALSGDTLMTWRAGDPA